MAPIILKKNITGEEVHLISKTPLRGIDKAEQKQELLGASILNISVQTNYPLEVGIGDTIEQFGQLYMVNQLPSLKREGEARLTYELTLEGLQNDLLRAIFFDTDSQGNSLSSTFALTGNLAFFAQVLLNNITRVVAGWALGTCTIPGELNDLGVVGPPIQGTSTVTKTLTFENENCLSVLQRLCSEWGTEFSIEYHPGNSPSRTLNISPVGQALDYTFQYGRGNGLYELSRRSAQQAPFFNRLYVYGSSKNLPTNYREYATRLQLPISSRGPIVGPTYPWSSKIDNTISISIYGTIESTKIFEEVYPHRTGTVGSVTSRLKFIDPDIPFNPFAIDRYDIVNSNRIAHYQYKIEGMTPKIHFQSGQLAGYDFEIADFDPNTKTFTINPFKDEHGQEFPDPINTSPFQVLAGDTYVLLDISMPDEYVEAAEQQLYAAGRQWLADNGSPSVEYSLSLDEQYLQKLASDTGPIPIDNPPAFFSMGDQIRVVDTQLGIDQYSRIIGLSRDVLRPYKYTLTLGDAPKVPLLARILSHQKDVTKVLNGTGIQQAPKGEVPTKTETLKEILEHMRGAVHGIRFTLSATPLPPDFRPVSNGPLVRYNQRVNAYATLPGTIRQVLIGTTHAIGLKKL